MMKTTFLYFYPLIQRYIAFGKNAVFALLCLIIYQLCYSIAPLFLGKGIVAKETDMMIGFIFVYLLFNFLPYPIVFFQSLFLNKWKVKARQHISMVLLETLRAKYGLLGDRVKSQKAMAVMTGNSQTIVSSTIDFIADIVSDLSASFLTLMVVAFYSNWYLMIAYAISLILLSVVVRYTAQQQKHFSSKSEKSLNKVLATLSENWGTVTLAQKPFFSVFHRQLKKRWATYNHWVVATTTYFQKVSMLQAVIVWMPSVVVIALQMIVETREHTLVLIAFLPRMVELMLGMSCLAMNLMQVSHVTGRLQWLHDVESEFNTDESSHRIQADRIDIYRDGIPVGSLKSMGVAFFFDPKLVRGRIRMTGANGVGKSSLLLHLKNQFGDDALFVSSTCHQGLAAINRSDGEAYIHQIHTAINWARMHNIRVLLLDEWNANLDDDNAKKLNTLFDELAKTILVVEATHH